MPPRAQPLLLAAVAAHAAATQGHTGQRAQAAANPWRWVLRRALQAPLAGLSAAAEEGPPGSEGEMAKRGRLPPLVRPPHWLMKPLPGHSSIAGSGLMAAGILWHAFITHLLGPVDAQQVGALIALHVCT